MALDGGMAPTASDKQTGCHNSGQPDGQAIGHAALIEHLRNVGYALQRLKGLSATAS